MVPDQYRLEVWNWFEVCDMTESVSSGQEFSSSILGGLKMFSVTGEDWITTQNHGRLKLRMRQYGSDFGNIFEMERAGTGHSFDVITKTHWSGQTWPLSFSNQGTHECKGTLRSLLLWSRRCPSDLLACLQGSKDKLCQRLHWDLTETGKCICQRQMPP